MDTIAQIVRRYRGDLNQDDFADKLSETLFPFRTIRKSHISLWENGTTPEIFSMLYLRDYGSLTERRMAIEVINAIQNSD